MTSKDVFSIGSNAGLLAASLRRSDEYFLAHTLFPGAMKEPCHRQLRSEEDESSPCASTGSVVLFHVEVKGEYGPAY